VIATDRSTILRAMAPHVIRVLIESTPRKTFASALDWPGLARGARDEPGAIEALLAAAPRYAQVAAAAGQPFATADLVVDVVERVEGDASTAFGVPAMVADDDRRPTDADEAVRLAAIVEASWAAFDRIAAVAPEDLRKGPRGGGRNRTKVVEHVHGGDDSYASVLGVPAADRRSAPAIRARVLAILRLPSDGLPIAGKKWPPRYAARRIAWHALDHAWEIEDRTDPA
jgi:hypothetical protein